MLDGQGFPCDVPRPSANHGDLSVSDVRLHDASTDNREPRQTTAFTHLTDLQGRGQDS
jgi:hypothetical protein